MGAGQSFVTGRIRRRLLRTPVIEGWRCAEGEAGSGSWVRVALESMDDGGLGLRTPHGHDLARISPEGATLLEREGEYEITVGWPEPMAIVRSAGSVVFAEGDLVHFGPLALDSHRTLRRSGYEYLDPASAEVRVQLTCATQEGEETALLGPGETGRFGPYTVFHERSFDPSDRPTSVRRHGYQMRLRRAPAEPDAPPFPDLPHPLDLEHPEQVVALARRLSLLDPDESALSESEEFDCHLRLYEGPASVLEQAVRRVGPNPPTFRRRGDAIDVVDALLARDDKGSPVVGRIYLTLYPTGVMVTEREELERLPGRMRRSSLAP